MNNVQKKIAIVYDWIDKWGGVERVLLALHEIFPQAQFFTSYFDKKDAKWAKDLPITTSFIQYFPDFIKKNRVLSFPLYPYAFESFDFRGYDLVISVTSSFAKGIITRPETKHICYMLTPTRYLWRDTTTYLKTPLRRGVVKKYRIWDSIASLRPDKILTLSKTVADRCKKYYGRDSEVLYPPFDVEYWRGIKSRVRNQESRKNKPKFVPHDSKFYLVVSRLEPYKRVDLVIDVFNERKDQLVIVGKGTEYPRLAARAKNNITFLNDLTDVELAWLYSRAQALIIPQEEDFGYIAVEAQFFGCPTIAYHSGGTVETLDEGKTALFFEDQSAQSLSAELASFAELSYNLKRSTQKFGPGNVVRFSKQVFQQKLQTLISNPL